MYKYDLFLIKEGLHLVVSVIMYNKCLLYFIKYFIKQTHFTKQMKGYTRIKIVHDHFSLDMKGTKD